MSRRPEAQQQPPYPQQYPPQNYGPPYYQPYPPPKRDDKKIMIIILIVVIVVFVVPTVLAAVLYLMVIDLAPTDSVVPTGVWGSKTLISSTSISVDFGKVNPEPRPVYLSIILIRNGTEQGRYVFNSNSDGALSIISGVPVGTLTYRDLTDNERVNTGDSLLITDLQPNSDYSLKMIWAPTGDQITTTSFSTPA